jgi:hypothetical protein
MTYQRMHGQEQGIAERLKMWRRHLGGDKSYPWLGTGICDDLVTAARLLGADVSEFTTLIEQSVPVAPQPMEFDL